MSAEKDAVVKNILNSHEPINRLYARMHNNGQRLQGALSEIEIKLRSSKVQGGSKNQDSKP